MSRRALRLVWFLLLCSAAFAQTLPPPQKINDLKPSVLLISFDGFRWDYLDHANLPHFRELMKRGLAAEALIPSFPTKTFPNHYTIVTGLYPAHHGIIANNIWDPHLNKKFTTDNRAEVRDPRWWGGEPIWVTAHKAGQKTGVLFWPGSEAPIEGVWPDEWLPHDSKMTHEKRLETFFSWLDKPQADRPTFFTLYFQDVDDAGHDFGPGSKEQIAAVEKVDATLGKLLYGLKQRGIFDKLNVVIVSDHGMVAVEPDNNIFIDDYLNEADIRVSDYNPVLMLNAGEKNMEVIAKLRKAPHLTVYGREELPARLHFSGNDRISPIIALADPGWMITTHKRFADKKKPSHGEHGYDNALKDTWGIFIAHGPAFRSGKRIPPFANIHIYSALCAILGLQPAPNDGSFSVLAPVLRVRAPRPPQTAPRTNAPRTTPAADRRSQMTAQ